MTYFDDLGDKLEYQFLVVCDVYRKDRRSHSQNFLFKAKTKFVLSFANSCIKGLCHFNQQAQVRIYLLKDCSLIYKVRLNNITVPYIAERYMRDGSTIVSEPHYNVNPFF